MALGRGGALAGGQPEVAAAEWPVEVPQPAMTVDRLRRSAPPAPPPPPPEPWQAKTCLALLSLILQHPTYSTQIHEGFANVLWYVALLAACFFVMKREAGRKILSGVKTFICRHLFQFIADFYIWMVLLQVLPRGCGTWLWYFTETMSLYNAAWMSSQGLQEHAGVLSLPIMIGSALTVIPLALVVWLIVTCVALWLYIMAHWKVLTYTVGWMTGLFDPNNPPAVGRR